jgi:hypothetical protein
VDFSFYHFTTKACLMSISTTATISPEVSKGNKDDAVYTKYLKAVEGRFLNLVQDGQEPIFTTGLVGEDLWKIYLENLPLEDVQYCTCHACRRFISTYGGLVFINEDGSLTSAFWDPAIAQERDQASVSALKKTVESAKVSGVFLSEDRQWGTPVTGDWIHLGVIRPRSQVYHHRIKTAHAEMANKRQNYQQVIRGLLNFPLGVLNQAIALLEADTLEQEEHVLPGLRWFRDLQQVFSDPTQARVKNHLVWKAVAKAPDGFCHPQSNVASTLLDDLVAGLPFEEVARKFKAKMAGDQYMRPQVPPSNTAIEAAERLVEKLGMQESFRRRTVRMKEVETLWTPPDSEAASKTEGVFGCLKTPAPGTTPLQANNPPVMITWEKFHRTVLPIAKAIHYYITPYLDNYGVLTTAAVPEAPPILQWDLEEARNPVSQYFRHGGGHPSEFNLVPGTLVEVEGITYSPWMWKGKTDRYEHHGKGILMILAGARETQRVGVSIFPQDLKSELHPIRAVVEAASKRLPLEGIQEEHVVGVGLPCPATRPGVRIQVTTENTVMNYWIDRWD